MANPRGVAATVAVTTLSAVNHTTPTQPVAPVATVSLDSGVTYAAATSVPVVTPTGITLALVAAETTAPATRVRVTSTNCDTATSDFEFVEARGGSATVTSRGSTATVTSRNSTAGGGLSD